MFIDYSYYADCVMAALTLCWKRGLFGELLMCQSRNPSVERDGKKQTQDPHTTSRSYGPMLSNLKASFFSFVNRSGTGVRNESGLVHVRIHYNSYLVKEYSTAGHMPISISKTNLRQNL